MLLISYLSEPFVYKLDGLDTRYLFFSKFPETLHSVNQKGKQSLSQRTKVPNKKKFLYLAMHFHTDESAQILSDHLSLLENKVICLLGMTLYVFGRNKNQGIVNFAL